MNRYFPEIKKNFGFGCMRLPMTDGRVNQTEFCAMIDLFLKSGFNYFDTAHGYLDGQSETALRECLVKRYPRESYILTDKLSCNYFDRQEEIRPYFDRQREACGVDYFDFYLMHAQNAELYDKYRRCRAYETALELKAEGKIRHFGLSFHDKATVLDRILTDYPQVEVVQIQFNYADYDDPTVEGRQCYEVCRKHGKPIIVMEPVKGGSLVKLPDRAQRIFDALGGGSNAGYALRYAAGFAGMAMVISGMCNLEQMQDNLATMQDFRPLDEREQAAVARVQQILRGQDRISCTACRYCTEVCPQSIPIPELFACLNEKRQDPGRQDDCGYAAVNTAENRRASDCLRCGRCEAACPQHLPIRSLLAEAAEAFEA